MDRPGSKRRALLTGAAGFIGSHVADRMLADGWDVVGLDNFDRFYPRSEKMRYIAAASGNERFRLAELDCADATELDAALRDEPFDVVVHLAAKAGVRPSIEDPVGYTRANLLATQAMLELARGKGIRRFVFGSSSSVYGDSAPVPFSEDDPALEPISPYAATKRAGELLCRAHQHLHGGSMMALRFFTVYGPRQRPDLAIRKFATRMLDGVAIPVFGDGSTERDYTWIDDIVDGVIAAIDWTAENESFDIVNLGESRTTSLARLIELIADVVGVEPIIDRQPMQPGDVRRTFADVTKAKRVLGYQPSMTVEEGIPRFVEWLRRWRAAGGEYSL
ncbi:MAG: GDP-mannose 4,6-dehydratase [Gemmatimonadota bacterium]